MKSIERTSSVEKEIKLNVIDLRRIESRLKDLGAELTQNRVLETNLRFDLPDHCLEREHKALRLRFDTHARLTYKGPSALEGSVLTRTELEVDVDNFDTAVLLLDALGYIVTVKYEKYRTTYTVQGCQIMLDELPIGNFVEIEGQHSEVLAEIAQAIGLDARKAIPMSYIELFNQVCKEQGFDKASLTFSALKDSAIDLKRLEVSPADQA